MALVERFEDLLAWKKARQLRRLVYSVTSTTPFQRDIDLKRQMRRAAISVESNIAEGFERASKAGFAHFLVMARGSCGEIRAQAWAALDENMLSATQFEELRRMCADTARVITALHVSITPPKEGS